MALTTDQFRDQVIASGLLTAEDLSSILTALPTEKPPRDGEQLARELVRQKKLTRFQAEQIYLGKGKSLVLGNYTILEKLGQGGMGMVLKAEHKRLKRLVALKVLSPAALKTPDALKRFHREVEAAAKLRHTNVVATDDADEAKGTHFLVMEYVEGSDLSALVKKKGPLSVGQAVQCILQAARGLEYAHEQGVVHRDIKPANLLLDTKGTVKILDMGLARIEGDSAGRAELTSTGAVMGTVDYMAPEQALSTKSADARSDIYSLGISLWYLLTGKCVFDGDTLMAKLLAHRDAPIPSLCAARSEVSASIDVVFQKMVAKQAKDRYQSMTEVIRDLEACQGGASSTSSLSVSTVDDDANPFSFLNSPDRSTTTAVNTRQSRPTAKHSAAGAAAEATMLTGDLDQATDPQTMTSVRSSQKRTQRSSSGSAASPPWWQDRRVQIGGGAAAVLLLLAVVFLFQTPNGTLRVEILDPEVEMKVKGTELTFHGSDLEPVSLKAGEKRLLVTRGDLSFETEGFTLKKGAETRVKVELLGDKLVVNGGGKVIAEQPIQRNGITTSTTGRDSVVSTSPSPNSSAPPPAIAPFDAKQARAHQEAWAKHLGVPVEYTNSIGMKFMLIPPGEFMMGCDPKEAEAIAPRIEDERLRQVFLAVTSTAAPRHVVRITRAYYLQTHEVTNGAYQQVMGKLPEKNDPAKPDWPVMSNVGLADATAFCDALSQKEGKASAYRSVNGNLARIREANGYRLPTEAEWEYACRAGTTTLWFMGDDDRTVSDCDRLKEFQTYIVGAGAKPNPFGLFDLYGGSSEWCFDSFAPYEPQEATDPFTEPNGSEAVARGGSFFSGGGASIVDVNSVARQRGLPNNVGNDYTGLGRVLLPIEMPDPSRTPRPGVPPASSGKLFMHDPAFPLWMKDVQAMSAEKQVEAVREKLMELNPGFDGSLSAYSRSNPPKVTNGVVTEFGFDAKMITDLSPVRALTNLQVLNCSTSPVSPRAKLVDLSPLQGMKLGLLYCSNTSVSDLSPLEGIPLNTLFCDNTQVSDLSPLAGMKLVKLLCENTPVADVQVLQNQSSLKNLNIRRTKVIPAAVAALQQALPDCKIEWDDSAKAIPTQPATTS